MTFCELDPFSKCTFLESKNKAIFVEEQFHAQNLLRFVTNLPPKKTTTTNKQTKTTVGYPQKLCTYTCTGVTDKL